MNQIRARVRPASLLLLLLLFGTGTTTHTAAETAATVPAAQPPAARHEFWFGSIDPVVQRDRKVLTPADYLELFAQPTKWPVLGARVSTFEISTQLVLRGMPEEQQTVLRGLRARHIKLAGQFGVVVQSPDPACGGFGEGRTGPNVAAAVAKKLHDIGGQLDYLNMDEPVTFGHNSPYNKCPQSIPQLAQIAAQKVAAYRQVFPALKVNLIDGVGGRDHIAVDNEVLFVDLLGKDGVHIDYFLADVQWGSPNWQPQFEELATKLHARGIKVGLYCDGMLTSKSDLVWDRDSVNNCKTAGNDPKIAPDLFMIASWSAYPTRVLPENEPGTLTHIGKELMTIFP